MSIDNESRPWQLFLAFSLFFVITTLARPAVAQNSLEISENEVAQNYPNTMTFSLKASAGESLEEVTLRYGTTGRSCQSNGAVQPIAFDPASSVALEWEWDWTRFGVLPPGTTLWWEWKIVASSGQTTITERQFAIVADNRQSFKRVQQDSITIFWIQGDGTFGDQLLTFASAGLLRLENEMGIQLDEPITIVVYPNAADVQAAVIHVPEWAGGIAFPRYNSIIVGIAPGQDAWAASVIPHELTHLVVGALTFNCIGIDVPTWLKEGLAEYGETGAPTSIDNALLEALDDDEVPELRRLADGFSAYGSDASLAYLQSKAIVTYLIEQFGTEKILELLTTIRDGAQIDEALAQVYNLNQDTLDAVWRESLGYQPLPTRQPTPDPANATPVPTIAPFTLELPTGTPTPELTDTVPATTSTATSPPFETVEPSAVATEAANEVAVVKPAEVPTSLPEEVEERENVARAGGPNYLIIGVVLVIMLALFILIGRNIRRRSG